MSGCFQNNILHRLKNIYFLRKFPKFIFYCDKNFRHLCYNINYRHLGENAKTETDFSKEFSTSVQNAFSQLTNKSCSKRLKRDAYLYIADKYAADDIASYLCGDDKETIIFEANPGPGILSKAILDSGASCLRVFEKNSEFTSSLKVLESLYKERLQIVEEDLMLLPSFEAKVKSFGLDFGKYFHHLPEISWDKGISFKLVSIVADRRSINFLRYLLAILPTTSSIFAYGRCEFYFLLCESEYKYITAEPRENFTNYRWSTVLYNLFFEIKCLQKKPIDESQLHLVKLTPKLNLFESVAPRNQLPQFYFFVRHHLVKRTALVIPTLESWVPFCGPRLIKEGMNVFTKFGDLSPDQILVLFKQFTSWPEYEDSPFTAAAKTFYNKKNFVADDDENI